MRGKFVIGATVVALYSTSVSVAQEAPVVATALVGAASAAQVEEFKARPGSLVARYPIGGPQLASSSRGLVLADQLLFSDLIEVARAASPVQRAAVCSGLGQAVRVLQDVNRAAAEQISQGVASSGMADCLAGYSAAVNGVATLAVGGGAGGFAVSSGGPGGPVGGFGGGGSGGNVGSLPGGASSANTVRAFAFGRGSVSALPSDDASVSPVR